MRRFITSRTGATALETAMIASILALALVAATQAVGPVLASAFQAAAQALGAQVSSQTQQGRS